MSEGWFEVSGDGWEEPRHYEIEGRRLPSVTTILSVISVPFLAPWRGRVGNEEADRVTEEAGMFGQDMHDWTALEDMGIHTEPPPDLALWANAYTNWKKKTVRAVVEVELVVYSLEWGYAGRLDRVFEIQGDAAGELTLGDLKTGTVDKKAAAQTAAYQNAYQEMRGEGVSRRLILPLSRKEGRMKRPIEYKDFDSDFTAFLWALGLYRWLGR